ncbi:MAG: M23 family metallopeptidase [Acidobacteriota bacterium]
MKPTSPRPTVEVMQRKLAAELSPRRRIVYLLLLLFDLLGAVAVASLWLTEPGLPVRTQLAFAGLLALAVAWAVFFAWTLSRRHVLLAEHRLIAGRLAVVVTGAFTAGAVTLALTQADLRHLGLTASAFGAALVTIAGLALRQARQRHRALLHRRDELLRKAGIAVLLSLFVGITGFAPAVQGQLAGESPLEVQAQTAPQVVDALGRKHLVYELHLTNFGTTARQITRLAVLGESGDEIAAWEGEALHRRLATVGNPSAAPGRLSPGGRAIAYLWLALAAGTEAPKKVSHRVETTTDERLEDLSTAPLEVEESPEPILAAPVGAGTWVALRGPSNASGHRRALIALNGSTSLAQRFAVDWARLGPDGRLFAEDGSENHHWYGFGEAVLAMAGGRVHSVRDHQTDHPPGAEQAALHSNRAALTGNTVVIDEGDGRYSTYAHLRAGSIRVAPGDRVAAGEPIAEIGNSGHSLAPHLHHHLSDQPESLAGEGRPFRLSSYQLLGRLAFRDALAGKPWQPSPQRPARWVKAELPLENMVLRLAASKD